MTENQQAMIVFTMLVGMIAYGGWLPWSFFFVAAFVTALLSAIKKDA